MASSDTTFPVRLVTPEGPVFDGEARLLVVTSSAGELGIMARHQPVVADLCMGTVRVENTEGATQVWATAEGFAKAHDSEALVLVEEAIAVEDIDLADVERMVEDHRGRVRDADGGEHDVYSSTVGALERTEAWGEHLRAMQEKYAVASR